MKSKEIIIRDFTMDDYEQVTALWTEAGIHYRPNGRESRIRMAKELKAGQAEKSWYLSPNQSTSDIPQSLYSHLMKFFLL